MLSSTKRPARKHVHRRHPVAGRTAAVFALARRQPEPLQFASVGFTAGRCGGCRPKGARWRPLVRPRARCLSQRPEGFSVAIHRGGFEIDGARALGQKGRGQSSASHRKRPCRPRAKRHSANHVRGGAQQAKGTRRRKHRPGPSRISVVSTKTGCPRAFSWGEGLRAAVVKAAPRWPAHSSTTTQRQAPRKGPPHGPCASGRQNCLAASVLSGPSARWAWPGYIRPASGPFPTSPCNRPGHQAATVTVAWQGLRCAARPPAFAPKRAFDPATQEAQVMPSTSSTRFFHFAPGLPLARAQCAAGSPYQAGAFKNDIAAQWQSSRWPRPRPIYPGQRLSARPAQPAQLRFGDIKRQGLAVMAIIRLRGFMLAIWASLQGQPLVQ